MDHKLNHHLALAETSSVVAHDLCAQLHVMKFCLEELSSDRRVSKKLYEEYVQQLHSSTEYMDHLLGSFRGLVKLEDEPGATFKVGPILNYAQHLTRCHYQSMSRHLYFDKDSSLSFSQDYEGCGLDYAHTIFAIYCAFVECVHHRVQKNEYHFSHEMKLLNDKRCQLGLTLKGAEMTRQDFIDVVQARTNVKGRLRQWGGLNHIHHELEKDNEFFQVVVTDSDTTVSIKLPKMLER